MTTFAPLRASHDDGSEGSPEDTSSLTAPRTLADDPEQPYLLYVPTGLRQDSPLLVSIHGISRNASEHVQLFTPLAERYGVALVAPLFTTSRFPDYQRLSCDAGVRHADVVIDRIVAEVSGLLGLSLERFHLFGYSGGGQFAHRYVMAHPEHVAAAVIAAAGWYTFPDPDRSYPFGIGACPRYGRLAFDPLRFLRVPVHVLVGERDCRRDRELRQSAVLDRTQGRTRLERGRRWVDAMARAAWEHGLGSVSHFDVLSHCGHSFAESMRRGGMGYRVFTSLFGPPPTRPPKRHGAGRSSEQARA